MATNNGDISIRTGAVIKSLRKALGLSQMALAEKVGVTYQQIQKYEKGTSQLTTKRLYSLSSALKTTPEGLIRMVSGDMPTPERMRSVHIVASLVTKNGQTDRSIHGQVREFLSSIEGAQLIEIKTTPIG